MRHEFILNKPFGWKKPLSMAALAVVGVTLAACSRAGDQGLPANLVTSFPAIDFGVGLGSGLGGVSNQNSALSTRGVTASGPDFIQDYISNTSLLPGQVRANNVLQPVEVLYRRNQFQPLWHNGQNWLPAAVETAQILRNAKRHGLIPDEYLPDGNQLPNFERSNPAAITQAEMTLTSGLLRYIVDVREGRYAPNKRLDPVAEFLVGAEGGRYVTWLESLGASNWMYRRMTAAVGQHDALSGAAFDRYRVTMERLRWDAPDVPSRGRFILLNVGSAEVWAMNGLNIDLGVNAVVGRQSRRTPLSDDAITSLKFSPDWTAPYSIIEKDLVKFAKEDPAFVNLMGVEIFRNGRKVDPFSLNWNTINVRNYVWKQPPGPANVLGGVRFTLQNSQSIYMHDSPDKSLFDDPFRAKSSGCIRVGASDEFALWLLQGEDSSWTKARVEERMTRGEINFVNLKKKVEVRTIYTTAWVSHNGTLTTNPDVYGENTALRQRMGLPIEPVDDNGAQQVSAISDVF